MSVNKVILLGTLGRDPEVKSTSNGQSVAAFSMATNEKWTDKGGQKQEKTEWHRVVAWGKLAELCGEYLSKGKRAYVEGRIESRKYQAKDGSERTVTEVVASTVQFLDRTDSGGHGARAQRIEGRSDDDFGSDVPF